MATLQSRLEALIPKNSLVPAKVLQRHFDGHLDPITGADNPGIGYSDADKETLLVVAERNVAHIKALPSFSQPLWISAAGGPGSGKTTALLQYVAQVCNPAESGFSPGAWKESSLAGVVLGLFMPKPFAFISADRRSLLSLTAQDGHFAASSEAFYTKWRWGANFLSNLDMSVAFACRKHIVHDTTLAGHSNLEAAQRNGYYITVIAAASPLETRTIAADKRNETYFQSFPYNVAKQNEDFAAKLPTTVGQADEVYLAWRDTATASVKNVAFIKDQKWFAVRDIVGFAKFCEQYPQVDIDMIPYMRRFDVIDSEIPRILAKQGLVAKPKIPAPQPT